MIRGYNPYSWLPWDWWFDLQIRIRAAEFKEELFQMRVRALREINARLGERT